MSYIGIKGAGRLDLCNHSSSLLKAQTEAVRLLNDETDMRTIKQLTGWEIGVDGKWRYELPDPFHKTEEIEDHIKRHFGEPLNIRYCMHDTTLLSAYPNFEKLRLFARYTPTPKFSGYFDSENYGMMICMGTTNSPFQYQTEGVLLHEVQHLIQAEEGFAHGGNTCKGIMRYLRLAGEVEARNVCIRHSMSQEERRSTLRSETQDIPDNEQIIEFSHDNK